MNKYDELKEDFDNLYAEYQNIGKKYFEALSALMN